jgi:uncharacterized protein (TIGR03435 family)
VLIDRTGVVRAVTTPLAVTAESIEDLLAGRPIRLRSTEDQLAARKRIELGEPLLPLVQTTIRPAQANVGLSSVAPGRLELRGKPLTSSVYFLTDVPHDRMEGTELLPDDPFDVIVQLPPEQDDRLREVLSSMLRAAFGVSVRTEMREVEAWVLKRAAADAPAVRAADPDGPQSSSGGPGRLTAVGCPLGHVGALAQRELGGVVVDETGPGVFDFELTYAPGDRDAFLREMREQLGLVAERARRRIEYAVIERAPATAGRP